MVESSRKNQTKNEAIAERFEKILEQRLPSSENILTDENKKRIDELLFLYDLNLEEMVQAIKSALTEENSLDINRLKQVCNDLFIHKNKQNNELKTNLTKENELISRLESISPKQLLKDLSGGNHVSEYEMEIIEEVMINQQLPMPVMNVLIHYVLLQSNMKLSKAYMERIASHWSRVNLKTAKEAMAYAKKQIEKQQNIRRQSMQTPQKKEKSDEKPFTVFEYRYIENLYDQYHINFDVAREIIYYGRKTNNGLMVYWFLNAVSEYIHRHKGKTVEDTKELLHLFHQKFVVNFGKE